MQGLGLVKEVVRVLEVFGICYLLHLSKDLVGQVCRLHEEDSLVLLTQLDLDLVKILISIV